MPTILPPSAIGDITADHIREFLDWTESETSGRGSTNPQGVRNKHHRHLAALLRYALDGERPRFPPRAKQRIVGSQHWFRDDELDALYHAAGTLPDHSSWEWPCSRAQVWQTAIVLWTNLGIDTSLLMPPDRRRRAHALRVGSFLDVGRDPYGTDLAFPHGCLQFNRTKTGHQFVVPLSATMRRHIVDAIAGDTNPGRLLLNGGCGRRPCTFFQRRIVAAARIAGRPIRRRHDLTRGAEDWQLKDFRNTAAQRTLQQFGLECSQAVVGHAPNNITQRHYAHALPLLLRVFVGAPDQPPITQPAAFDPG